jgi:hypothetical protein
MQGLVSLRQAPGQEEISSLFSSSLWSREDASKRPKAIGTRENQHHSHYQRLNHSKEYLRQFEKESGKDYRWIAPLTDQVSVLMKYVLARISI